MAYALSYRAFSHDLRRPISVLRRKETISDFEAIYESEQDSYIIAWRSAGSRFIFGTIIQPFPARSKRAEIGLESGLNASAEAI
ncbi:hypothetical protein [Sphingopyxis macrogoltabida]|uniref:Uncharacterized protein n=1 Tax=Sphingopyxis macrogoltabida TaxID=33050 RepID=A0AAC9AZL5_SPHMC|nr:hypothetical protein [Sphingopyxis macrogoltabida]ALJ16466.1 hypothetical protein LH19_27070 [Sphingopyxis macrogoltabida]AMU92702.1 hypothetical protein ATM17_31065 [Sphingopyxis macrogoltabida]